MKKINYKGTEFAVVDDIKMNGEDRLIAVLPNHVYDYENTGLDTDDSLLKVDYNVHKEYDNGVAVFHIVNDETGYLAGYYGLAPNDPEVTVI